MTKKTQMTKTPWQSLTVRQRQALSRLALECLDIETLEERGRDRLDFKEVSVWCLREALARAFLAGAGHPMR